MLAVIIAAVWHIISISDGRPHFGLISTLVFALLFFESMFLILLRWIKSNIVAVLASLFLSMITFLWFGNSASFALINSIIIIATLGATTLLIRMNYLRTRLMFVIAILWTIYDIMAVNYIFPKIFVPTDTPQPNLMFPAVTVGNLSLGSGDFMFLTLFTLIILKDHGRLSALILVVGQTIGLIATGLFLPEQGFHVPFLVVMTPIFFLIHFLAKKLKLPLGQPG